MIAHISSFSHCIQTLKFSSSSPNFFKSTIHWDAYGPEHKSAGTETYKPSDDFYDEWHVAQFVWGKESYKLFLDGKLM